MPTGKAPQGPILLDTHVWLWLMNGDPRLDKPALIRRIEEAVERTEAYVSVISVWEIAMLEVKGRIQLPYSVFEWVHRALGDAGISPAPLNPDIAIESAHLPEAAGFDPADRIIMATAASLGACLWTHDERMLAYARGRHLNVLAV